MNSSWHATAKHVNAQYDDGGHGPAKQLLIAPKRCPATANSFTAAVAAEPATNTAADANPAEATTTESHRHANDANGNLAARVLLHQ